MMTKIHAAAGARSGVVSMDEGSRVESVSYARRSVRLLLLQSAVGVSVCSFRMCMIFDCYFDTCNGRLQTSRNYECHPPCSLVARPIET